VADLVGVTHPQEQRGAAVVGEQAQDDGQHAEARHQVEAAGRRLGDRKADEQAQQEPDRYDVGEQLQ